MYLCSMIELSRHIEKLLLTHDCVIVPQLGGFVTQYVSARHIGQEALFLPPHRTVGFNPQLVFNDGLLVQSYMQVHETNYPETLRLIEEAVAEVKKQLQEHYFFDLHGIGRLEMDLGGRYTFVPNEAGILSPGLYGLGTIDIQALPQENAGNDCEPAEQAEEEKVIKAKKKKEAYTLSISKDLINYTAAAVVAIFIYFAWATPIGPTVTNNRQPIAARTFMAPVTEPAPAASQETNATPTAARPAGQNTADAQKADPAAEKPYTIVLVSKVTRKNAAEYTEKMREKGFSETETVTRKDMVRVVYGHFADEAAAYARLKELRHTVPDFAEAWVMRL